MWLHLQKGRIQFLLTSWSLLGVFSYTERASILNHHKSVVFPFHNLFVSFLLLLPLLLLITKCNQKLQKYRDLILTCFLFTLFTRGYGRICNWIGAFLLHGIYPSIRHYYFIVFIIIALVSLD